MSAQICQRFQNRSLLVSWLSFRIGLEQSALLQVPPICRLSNDADERLKHNK